MRRLAAFLRRLVVGDGADATLAAADSELEYELEVLRRTLEHANELHVVRGDERRVTRDSERRARERRDGGDRRACGH